MKSVKISIQDENTLVLQEDANKGDLIDLTSIHETDIDKATIQSVVNSIKKDAFDAAVKKEISSLEERKELEAQIKEREIKEKSSEDLRSKDSTIAELRNQLNSAETAKELAVTKAVSDFKEQLVKATAELESKDKEKDNVVLQLNDKHAGELRLKDEQIAQYKDFKAKQSVKIIGESLEQYCQNEFNSVRTTMFPHAYFEKDNEAIKDEDETKGTKGDFIYRDFESKGGAEVISVMFEMKDEQNESSNKRTIDSHLDKLNKDRNKKGLEYAVLVTLLESDNELYNRGIVDVSFRHEKMFVIRPQFFLPLISLLKNASMKSAEDKRQLVDARNSNIDIETFAENVENWKSSWSTNMKNAAKKHVEAVEQIDKAIKDLEKVRDALTMSNKHLLTAENKMDDLTIKRVTKNAPSVAEKFKELGQI